MVTLPENVLTLVAIILFAAIAIQVLVGASMLILLGRASRERAKLGREMFGLLRKIEGLTSHKQEQIARHYNELLGAMTTRVPPAVAAEASSLIVDLESQILTRLAELDTSLRSDEKSREKMDELIRSMEQLEETMISLIAEAVKKVMHDSRRGFLEKHEDVIPFTQAA